MVKQLTTPQSPPQPLIISDDYPRRSSIINGEAGDHPSTLQPLIISGQHGASSDPRKMYGLLHKLLCNCVSSPVLPDVDNTSAARTLSLAFFRTNYRPSEINYLMTASRAVFNHPRLQANAYFSLRRLQTNKFGRSK